MSFVLRTTFVRLLRTFLLCCRCRGWMPHTDTSLSRSIFFVVVVVLRVFIFTMLRTVHKCKRKITAWNQRIENAFILMHTRNGSPNQYVQCSYEVLSPVFISNQIPLFMTVFHVCVFIVLSAAHCLQRTHITYISCIEIRHAFNLMMMMVMMMRSLRDLLKHAVFLMKMTSATTSRRHSWAINMLLPPLLVLLLLYFVLVLIVAFLAWQKAEFKSATTTTITGKWNVKTMPATVLWA